MVTLYENATHLTVTGQAFEIDTLVDALRFRPNGYLFALSYQRYKVSGGDEGWDGYIYPMTRIGHTSGRVLRGRKDDILTICRMEKFKVDTSHLLTSPYADLEVDDIPANIIAGKFSLDVNQCQCICDWLRAGIGFNKVSVGGGKSATFAGAAAVIKKDHPKYRILYITQSERLVRQATKDMRGFLPSWDIGQCGGGRKEFDAKDMIISTFAMLNVHFHRLKNTHWFDTFICICMDEAHHVGSKIAQKILLAIPAYFRLGASDSGKEKNPTRYNDMRGLCGPLLNDIQSAPLIGTGRLAQPHIYVVNVPEWRNRFKDVAYRPVKGSRAHLLLDGAWVTGAYEGPVYETDADGNVKVRNIKTADKDENGNWIVVQEPVTETGMHKIRIGEDVFEIESRWCLLNRVYDRAIIQFKSRNEMIVRWAKYFSDQGWSTVVVATRTTHVYILEALLSKTIDASKVRILIGDDTPKERDEAFDWFKANPGSVLVTPLVREGVSINEIRAVIVADYVGDYDVARQIIGRALRPKDNDNRAHVVWFKDTQHPKLKKGFEGMLANLVKAEAFRVRENCGGPETVFDDAASG